MINILPICTMVFMSYESVEAWQAQGNCRSHPPETFFPEKGASVVLAQKICSTCPVEEVCLIYALTNQIDHGVWGGQSERGRRRLLKAMRSAQEEAEAS